METGIEALCRAEIWTVGGCGPGRFGPRAEEAIPLNLPHSDALVDTPFGGIRGPVP